MPILSLLTTVFVFALVGSVPAATITNFTGTGGSIFDAGNWDDGLPDDTKVGKVAVDGRVGTGGFSGDETVDHTAGTMTGRQFNYTGSTDPGTWNMSGGRMEVEYLLANGTTINFSGGTVVLQDPGHYISATNGGTIGVSGTAVLDATEGVDTPGSGTYEFSSGWSGYWIHGSFSESGTSWQDFLTGDTGATATLDGSTITDANFVPNGGVLLVDNVTGGGQELRIIPEPSSALLLLIGVAALCFRRQRRRK